MMKAHAWVLDMTHLLAFKLDHISLVCRPMELFHQEAYTCFRCQPYSMRTVTVYYSGHQYPSHTGSSVKSYHSQMRTVKDVNTSSLSLEHSAYPPNMHILLYLRDTVYANRSCFSVSPSLCPLSFPLSNYYSAFIEAGSFIACWTLLQPTQHLVFRKEQMNLHLAYYAGT